MDKLTGARYDALFDMGIDIGLSIKKLNTRFDKMESQITALYSVLNKHDEGIYHNKNRLSNLENKDKDHE